MCCSKVLLVSTYIAGRLCTCGPSYHALKMDCSGEPVGLKACNPWPAGQHAVGVRNPGLHAACERTRQAGRPLPGDPGELLAPEHLQQRLGLCHAGPPPKGELSAPAWQCVAMERVGPCHSGPPPKGELSAPAWQCVAMERVGPCHSGPPPKGDLSPPTWQRNANE